MWWYHFFKLIFHNRFCNHRVLILGDVFEFLLFLRRFTWAEMPGKRTLVKIGVNKTVIIAIFSLFPMNFANLHIASSCMAALEHNFDVCWLKLSWLSISIPRNFTDLVVSISFYYIFNLCVIRFSLLLFIIIAWLA